MFLSSDATDHSITSMTSLINTVDPYSCAKFHTVAHLESEAFCVGKRSEKRCVAPVLSVCRRWCVGASSVEMSPRCSCAVCSIRTEVDVTCNTHNTQLVRIPFRISFSFIHNMAWIINLCCWYLLILIKSVQFTPKLLLREYEVSCKQLFCRNLQWMYSYTHCSTCLMYSSLLKHFIVSCI